jgi:hypothetical protein
MGGGYFFSTQLVDARYNAVSGGESNRAILYVVRRHLRMSSREWQELPWWEQRVYIEGLIDEELLVTSDKPTTPIEQEDGIDPVMASDAELRRMGLTVIDGG